LFDPGVKGLALHGMADQVIAGRMSAGIRWSAGVQYVFNPFKMCPQKYYSNHHHTRHHKLCSKDVEQELSRI
jgi:hypothetical protein